MAKKERQALMFVRKNSEQSEILFAVVGMPERTTAPAETAHYILFSGNKNKRYKMKINHVTYATERKSVGFKVKAMRKRDEGKVEKKIEIFKTITDRTKIESCTPNFVKVEGKLLDEMYAKCSPAFKKQFPR